MINKYKILLKKIKEYNDSVGENLKNPIILLSTVALMAFTTGYIISSINEPFIDDLCGENNNSELCQADLKTQRLLYKEDQAIQFANFEDTLRDNIKRHEGLVNSPYKDSLGFSTVCYGHLLKKGDEVREYSTDECEVFLNNDIAIAKQGALKAIKNFEEQPASVQLFAIEFTYQVGEAGFGKFKRTIEAIENKDYAKARLSLAKTLFAKQMIKANKGKLTFNQRTDDYYQQLSYWGHTDFLSDKYYYEITKDYI